MKSKYKLVFVIGILIGFFLILLINSQISAALEPKLLWKKEIASKTYDASLAKWSGDVIFIHGAEKNRITLIDKNGNTVWQWGPSFKIVALPPLSISEDGKHLVYSSALGKSEDVLFCERSGKEIWRYKHHGYPVISPNGKYVFIANPPGWGGSSILLDSNKKILWKKDIGRVDDVIFTSDNNYIFFSIETGYCPDIYLFNINGLKHKKIGSGHITSISHNGAYIGMENENCKYSYSNVDKSPPAEGIYNNEGVLVLEGKNTISEDGNIVVSHFENRIEIKNFPDGAIINEYPVQRWKYPRISLFCRLTKVSSDGRYVAIFGKRTDRNSTSNLFLIDTMERSLWEETIENVGSQDTIILSLTSDGKFLFVGISRGKKSTFYYYQVY